MVRNDQGWFTTPPFSEPEMFDFPEGIGPVECVNVEHEEVLLMPRWVEARRVTVEYGFGGDFIGVLKTPLSLGLDRADKVTVGGTQVSPRVSQTTGNRLSIVSIVLVAVAVTGTAGRSWGPIFVGVKVLAGWLKPRRP